MGLTCDEGSACSHHRRNTAGAFTCTASVFHEEEWTWEVRGWRLAGTVELWGLDRGPRPCAVSATEPAAVAAALGAHRWLTEAEGYLSAMPGNTEISPQHQGCVITWPRLPCFRAVASRINRDAVPDGRAWAGHNILAFLFQAGPRQGADYQIRSTHPIDILPRSLVGITRHTACHLVTGG